MVKLIFDKTHRREEQAKDSVSLASSRLGIFHGVTDLHKVADVRVRINAYVCKSKL